MILTQAVPPIAQAPLAVFPPGWFATNPSLLRMDGGYLCVVKGVNFDFERIWLSGDWQATDQNERVACTYKVVHLDEDFGETACFDLDTSAVSRAFGKPVGVEDLRLFWRDGAVMACGCLVDRDFVWTGRRWIMSAAQSRIFVGELALDQLDNVAIFDSPSGADQEKNWAPVSGAAEIVLVVNVETGARLTCGADAAPPHATPPEAPPMTPPWSGGWSGSSSLVPWEDGYLAIVHRKARAAPARYRHMFVRFDRGLKAIRRSDPFSFEGRPVEFCCGLDAGPDFVTIAYGLMDKYAWIARFPRERVAGLLRHDVADGDLGRIDLSWTIDPIDHAARATALEAQRAALLQELYLQTLRVRDLEARLAQPVSPPQPGPDPS